jgi:hypothetical protein
MSILNRVKPKFNRVKPQPISGVKPKLFGGVKPVINSKLMRGTKPISLCGIKPELGTDRIPARKNVSQANAKPNWVKRIVAKFNPNPNNILERAEKAASNGFTAKVVGNKSKRK